jgi:hypothetical protein
MNHSINKINLRKRSMQIGIQVMDMVLTNFRTEILIQDLPIGKKDNKKL